jgi:phosphate starvation-inducible PhoH-like protein
MTEKPLIMENTAQLSDIFGNLDENIKLIEKELNVNIIHRGTELKISGQDENVVIAISVLKSLSKFLKKGEIINEQVILYLITLAREGNENINELLQKSICISSKGRPIKPKTFGQKQYTELIEKNTITLGIGPAGTGKTYLAVCMAVAAYKQKQISRIVLTRPAVEAGEKLGFLPGDLQEKVDPYLRPLYDALNDLFGEQHQKMIEKGIIEIAPLAYMRGRTLDDSFIILDEAQNTTPEQMKMFLTRLGFNSKAVITGDITQIDLPLGKNSGLIEASSLLKNINGIAICYFSKSDVVRNPLVQKIIEAYESKGGNEN